MSKPVLCEERVLVIAAFSSSYIIYVERTMRPLRFSFPLVHFALVRIFVNILPTDFNAFCFLFTAVFVCTYLLSSHRMVDMVRAPYNIKIRW